jgi:hypothetical protein
MTTANIYHTVKSHPPILRFVMIACLLAFGAFHARAQEQPTTPAPPAQDEKPSPCRDAFKEPNKHNFEDCGRIIFTHKPIHPLAPSSIVPGSGPAAGLAYYKEFNSGPWQRNMTTSAAVTFRGFWMVKSEVFFTHKAFGQDPDDPSTTARFTIRPYVQHWQLPRMDFYGLGPDSRKQDLAIFDRRDTTLGVEVVNPVKGWLSIGGSIESLWPHVEGVKDPKVRSIEALYNETTAPGLTKQPHFMRYEAFLHPHYPDTKPRHLDFRISYNYFQDTDTGHYSFHRFETDAHYFIRFGKHFSDDYADTTRNSKPHEIERSPRSRRSNLEFRALFSHSYTATGKEVPFYYQETLGGSDINSDQSLRGFRDYRFRGRDLISFQGEYQFQIWHGYGLVLFYDAGKVANRFDELGSARMRHSYGAGFTVWNGDRLYFRAVVGLGSGEGAHPVFAVPKLF